MKRPRRQPAPEDALSAAPERVLLGAGLVQPVLALARGRVPQAGADAPVADQALGVQRARRGLERPVREPGAAERRERVEQEVLVAAQGWNRIERTSAPSVLRYT